MYPQDQANLDFINQFVHAVTVRPFFEDLRRIKQASMRFRQLPAQARPDRAATEAA